MYTSSTVVSINRGFSGRNPLPHRPVIFLPILRCHLPIVLKPKGTRLPKIEAIRYFNERISLFDPSSLACRRVNSKTKRLSSSPQYCIALLADALPAVSCSGNPPSIKSLSQVSRFLNTTGTSRVSLKRNCWLHCTPWITFCNSHLLTIYHLFRILLAMSGNNTKDTFITAVGGGTTGLPHPNPASSSIQASETTPLLAVSSENPITQADSETLEINKIGSTAAAAEGDDEDKPLPVGQIILLCYARLVEPIAFFSIFPFIQQMILEVGGVKEEDVGFYSGLIVSTWCLSLKNHESMDIELSFGKMACLQRIWKR
jgi:hypothetical protein